MDSLTRAIGEEELLENLAWVQTLARRLVCDPGRADDVAQDAWLTALERPPRGTNAVTVRAWLARVVRTMARQSFRSESLRQRRERAVAREEVQPCASDVLTRTAMLQRVVEAVLALDEPERSTVLLRHVDGLSSRAIAERLGATPEAVRKRLSRAMAKLREQFVPELGDERESWMPALTPVFLAGGSSSTKFTLGKALGGVLVSKASWMVGVAVAVVSLTLGGWYLLREESPSASTRNSMPSVLSGSAVEPVSDNSAPRSVVAAEVEQVSDRKDISGSAASPGPTYSIRDPQDRLVAGTQLFLCREGSVIARGETRDDGHLQVQVAEQGMAKLLVLAPSWPAQVHEVSLAPVVHEVSLRSGATVSGWILVDGGTLSERIPLSLTTDRDFLDIDEELGVSLEELEIESRTQRTVAARAGTDGSFHFEGLPDDWTGRLLLPSDYRLTDPDLVEYEFRPCSTRLDGPTEELRIEVVKRLALLGRVVDQRDGKTISMTGATVMASIQYSEPSKTEGYAPQERTDGEGRFRFPLESASVHGGSLHLTSFDRKLMRRIELEPRELNGDWDLGDVYLIDPETTRTVEFVVRDSVGLPIVGAAAGIDNSSPSSEPTDIDGRSALRGVVPGKSEIVVYAVGYQATMLTAPLLVPDEITVTLERGAVLDLEVVSPDGELQKGLQHWLIASHHPLREGKQYPESIKAHETAGCSGYQWRRLDDGREMLGVYAFKDGRAIVNDVAPGFSLRLRVRAKSGALLHEQDIAPLGSEERRNVEVVLPRASRILRGVVLDEAGKPVPGAAVSLNVFAGEEAGRVGLSTMFSVAVDGSFTIGDLYTPTVSFQITSSEHATLSVENFELSDDETPVEFRLTSGHNVLVRIVDTDGRPAPGRAWVRKSQGSGVGGVHVRAVEMQLGEYLLRDLPAQEVTIRVRVHGVNYLRTHDALVPELEIVVPVLGELNATLTLPAQFELDDSTHLWLLPRDDAELVRRFGKIAPTNTGRVQLADVLPGEYDVVVRRWNGTIFDPDAWFEEFPGDFFEELSPRVRVAIRSNESTQVDIRP